MPEGKAVILAGGLGTRLYPITHEIAKPLLPVKGKPIINYLADLFLKQGIKDIFVLIPERFKDDFYWWKKRYYPLSKLRFVEEKEPLGTLGGLSFLRQELEQNDFLLTNGDELKEIDLNKLLKFHQQKGASATIALAKVPNPQDYGCALLNNDLIQEFLEKPENPPSNYISSGLYCLSPEIFKYHPGVKFCMIEKDLFPKLAQEGKLAGFKFQGKWMDCGTLSRWETAINQWKQN